MNAPDLDNLLNLLEQRDMEATPIGEATFLGTGRGVLTTDEVRRALLGADIHAGVSS